MTLVKGKKIIAIGATMLPVMVVGTLFFTANNPIRASKASAFTMSLNASNAPALNNGEGTMVDEKNVTWEYHNASSLNNGHVSIGHQGYFGISSASDWGYTAISELTVNFTAGTDAELWLLTSVDGSEWHEGIILESGVATNWANNWRYVRFYCWDDNNGTIGVTSVNFGYECQGISSTDDIDCAFADNIGKTNNLTVAKETSIVSPRGDSQEAVYLTRTGNSSYCEFLLKQKHMIHDLHTYTIEFDYYHKNNQNKPTVQFFNATGSVGGAANYGAPSKTNYKFSDIDSDWWHIEVQISSMVATHVGHSDTVTSNKEVDRIRLTTSNCAIDNLKIGGIPSNSNHPLGIYNNGTSFSNGGYYWMKVSWAGVLHSCTFSFDVPGIAEQENDPTSVIPFYLHGLSSGTVVVTATVVSGYNRSVATISNTITVN